MSHPAKASGSCLCGAIRFTVELPSIACAHCHCSMCRSHHGAAYATWLVVPRPQLTIDSGGDLLTRFLSSEHGSRSFCSRCGSSLFCDSTHRAGQIDVALAALRDPVDREPQVHIYFDSRAPWVRVDDTLPRLGGKTGLEPLP